VGDFDSSTYPPFNMPGEVTPTNGLRQFMAEMSARIIGGEQISLDEFATEVVTYAAFHCECGKPKRQHQRACGDCLMDEAGRTYDPDIHDPESVFFRDTYTGPSELELGGGCNRCGSPDDCYCNG
jgi:hypothetical protein